MVVVRPVRELRNRTRCAPGGESVLESFMQEIVSSKCLFHVFFVRVGHERRPHRSNDQAYYLAHCS
jgi:hypothetical protein